MGKEFTVENIEEKFDGLFKEIERLTDDIRDVNTVSLKQVYEAYEESKM